MKLGEIEASLVDAEKNGAKRGYGLGSGGVSRQERGKR